MNYLKEWACSCHCCKLWRRRRRTACRWYHDKIHLHGTVETGGVSSGKSKMDLGKQRNICTSSNKRGRDVYSQGHIHGGGWKSTKCCERDSGNFVAPTVLYHRRNYAKYGNKRFQEYEGGNAWQCPVDNGLNTRRNTSWPRQRSIDL